MDKKISLMWLGICFVAVLMKRGIVDGSTAVDKRSVAPERLPEDYPDYFFDVKYDDYPMIVPKKRAALLVDRLMVALQKAIEEEDEARELENALHNKNKGYSLRSEDSVRSMDLQRRGHGSMGGQQKGRVYWRCYFNAVTCF